MNEQIENYTSQHNSYLLLRAPFLPYLTSKTTYDANIMTLFPIAFFPDPIGISY